jgi:MinD superfamily P-loop ATPase
MTLAVASGKGGTGKTTIAVALSLLWPEPVRLVDADVEEPNCRFFLELTPGKEQRFTVPVPVIDKSRCTGCGRCSSFCSYGALVQIGKGVMFFPNLCHSCGGCTMVCPEAAIQELPREIGTLESAHFTALDGTIREHLWGTLDVGMPMAPPLIRGVKAWGENPAGGVIIDAPPGASCPMTSAVKGADLVLLVAENSSFGAHDLAKAHEALKLMKIPSCAVINRCDIGGGKAEALCEALGIPVLLRIPFQRSIAEAYAQGIHPLRRVVEFREAMLSLADSLLERTGGLAL